MKEQGKVGFRKGDYPIAPVQVRPDLDQQENSERSQLQLITRFFIR